MRKTGPEMVGIEVCNLLIQPPLIAHANLYFLIMDINIIYLKTTDRGMLVSLWSKVQILSNIFGPVSRVSGTSVPGLLWLPQGGAFFLFSFFSWEGGVSFLFFLGAGGRFAVLTVPHRDIPYLQAVRAVE